MQQPDFSIENHGTIILIVPNTPEARDKVETDYADCLKWAGAVVCEPRYIRDNIHQLQEEGFTIEV